MCHWKIITSVFLVSHCEILVLASGTLNEFLDGLIHLWRYIGLNLERRTSLPELRSNTTKSGFSSKSPGQTEK